MDESYELIDGGRVPIKAWTRGVLDQLYDELYGVAKAAREEKATRGERLDELLRRAEEILARKNPAAAAEPEEPKP